MKIAFVGGHFSPALSVIQQLPDSVSVVYIGRKYGMEGDKAISLEYQTITDMGIPYEVLVTGRLQRKFTKHTFASLLKLPKGFWSAYHILRKHAPDMIMSFGGYVSVPVGLAAFFLRIPLVIHEQTMMAGLANRILAPFAQKICLSWDSSKEFFPKNKIVMTGNPLLRFPPAHRKRAYQRLDFHLPLVVIVGGSQGSHAINMIIEQTLSRLVTICHLIHQTGDAKLYGDYDRLVSLKDTLPKNLRARYSISKFIPPDVIESLFQDADLVVTRGGINTITTLFVLAKPAIVIPLPVSQHDEQFVNAKFLEDAGLGQIILQKDLHDMSFVMAIEQMLVELSSYHLKKKDVGDIHKHAAETIVTLLMSLS